MLPGVEAARRRRFHNSTNNPEILLTTTRRSSFCLYASNNNDFHFSSATSSVQRNQQHGVSDESGLGAEAREAKKRLDKRLQNHRRSDTNGIQISQHLSRSLGERPITYEAEERELKKSGSKRLNWLKSNWKSSEQEECSICLEGFNDAQGDDDTLKQLPCAHKFHTKCLMPWLDDNSHCPCCRMKIASSILARSIS